MRKLVFKDAPERELKEHTPDEAEYLCEFINEFVWLPEEDVPALLEKVGAPSIEDRPFETTEDLLMQLADAWFYPNITYTVFNPAPNCRPVLQVLW